MTTQQHINLENHPQAKEFKEFTARLLNEQKDFWTKELGYDAVPEIAVSSLRTKILTELNKAAADEAECKEALQKYENDCKEREAKIEQAKMDFDIAKNEKLLDFTSFLNKYKFLLIKETEILFDTTTKYLWYVINKKKKLNTKEVFNLINNVSFYQLEWFYMPNVITFKQTKDNLELYKQGAECEKLFDFISWSYENINITVDVNQGTRNINNDKIFAFCCNDSLVNLEVEQIYNFFLEQDVLLTTTDKTTDFKFIKFTPPTLPPEIPKPEQKDCKVKLPSNIDPKDIKVAFQFNDNLRCNLDIIRNEEFTDATRGVWELYGIDENILKKAKVFARNPEDDIQSGVIGIDFGTSSTVVARDNNGRTELLRIGANNFDERSKAIDYENPTVLEFKNYTEMLKSWLNQERMPFVKWKDVNCSHAARNDWLNANTNADIVAAIFLP